MTTLPSLRTGSTLFGRRVPRSARGGRIAAVAFALFLSSSVALADPVRIVTGGGLHTGNYDTGFNLAGANFSFMISQWLDPLVNCGPCVPGSALDLSATLAVRDWAAGRATIDGHTYESVFFNGSFTFDAGSVTVPAMAPGQSGPDAQGLTRLFTNFLFTGTLAGFADASLTGTPLFSMQLIGDGIVRVAFSNYPAESGIHVLQLDYVFDEQAPVPEPGSLLLFGSGAAWLAARWRRRHHAADGAHEEPTAL
ncbi:MAG TPA: PEP-CTERM sorting domain-containing protein [Vicinamibacterales bacterium]|nr:PEP-CTERM sorting domain-containing protein [Vicinamibacterales bacterium]